MSTFLLGSGGVVGICDVYYKPIFHHIHYFAVASEKF